MLIHKTWQYSIAKYPDSSFDLKQKLNGGL